VRRAYRELTDDQLVQSWQSIWNALATDTLKVKNRSIEADRASEFALRKQPPPWELVKVQNALGKNSAGKIPRQTKWQRKLWTMEDFLTRRNRSN